MTKYLVLIENTDADPGAWIEVGTFEAHNAKGAVSAAITASDDPAKFAASGAFAATPAGMFQAVPTPKVNVKTTVSFA